MPSQANLQSITNAACLVVLRRSLGVAGGTSILLGCFWFLFAVLGFTTGEVRPLVVFNACFGVALLIEGFYVLRAKSLAALTANSITLAVLALFELSRPVLTHSHPAGMNVHPLLAAAIAYDAWRTWAARREYSTYLAGSNEETLAYVESVVDITLASAPSTTPNLILLKQSGLATSNPQWRIWFDGELAFLINVEANLGHKRLKGIRVCNRSSLLYEITGETWIGSSRKIKLTIDGTPVAASFEISREMLGKAYLLAGTAAV